MLPSCLVLVGEESVTHLCSEVLGKLGVRVFSPRSIWETFDTLENETIDLLLVDPAAPWSKCKQLRDYGAYKCSIPCFPEFLDELKRRRPYIHLILVGGNELLAPSGSAPVRSFSSISCPVDPSTLHTIVSKILQQRQSILEAFAGSPNPASHREPARLIGSSREMQAVHSLILKVSQTGHPVLILGETGTGKELVARAIHDQSPRREHPFVPIDVAGLSPALVESELFGHVRGAFTGADRTRSGLLEVAARGTAFLDEIAEIPNELQAKLLRVLQESEFRPVGSDHRKPLHCRVIAATNKDLEKAVQLGKFREDLYFRLNVVPIQLPPLRERKSDIPVLVHHFMTLHNPKRSEEILLSEEALKSLSEYNWPGNVRELENAVKHALTITSSHVLGINDLPARITRSPSKGDPLETVPALEQLERDAIIGALRTTGGDRVRAAQLLGIGKTTIYRKLKEYRLNGWTPSPFAA